jgi:hypothetical protein
MRDWYAGVSPIWLDLARIGAFFVARRLQSSRISPRAP